MTNEKASPVKKVPSKAEPSTKAAVKSTEDAETKLKERKQEENNPAVAKKDKNQAVAKSGKENKVEQTKNKKNLKNLVLEKPSDFDDGKLNRFTANIEFIIFQMKIYCSFEEKFIEFLKKTHRFC